MEHIRLPNVVVKQLPVDHIMTKKSICRASADVGFIMTAYNLRHLINIVGLDSLIGPLSRFHPFKKLKKVIGDTFMSLNKFLKQISGKLNYLFNFQNLNLILANNAQLKGLLISEANIRMGALKQVKF